MNSPNVPGSDHCHAEYGNDADVSAVVPEEACNTDYFAAAYTYMPKGVGHDGEFISLVIRTYLLSNSLYCELRYLDYRNSLDYDLYEG